MNKTKETAQALYDYFLIATFGTDPLFYANDYFQDSSAGNPIVPVTQTPSDQDQTPSTCLDIFVSPYIAGFSCHGASPFGEYGNNARGQGITWGTWMGFDLSLDQIEFKMKANHCVSKTNGICDTCESGYTLIVDSTSGRTYCQQGSTPSNVCPYPQILDIQSSSCILPALCKVEERKFALPQACVECHSSCSLCSGPSASDCLFQTCLQLIRFYPQLASSSFPAILYINGSLKKVWCESQGWTTILRNVAPQDVSSISFQNYETNGISDFPTLQFLPLTSLLNITQHHKLEVNFTLQLQSGETAYDHYAEFSITDPNYSWTVNHKKASSADLASLDLATLLNGITFQANSDTDANAAPCHTSVGSGSWYTGSCGGFALLGLTSSMFYGSLSSIASSSITVRQSHCLTWTASPASQCTQCQTQYLLTSEGVCLPCPAASSCDVSSCSANEHFFSQNSIVGTCLLDSQCNLSAFPSAGCSVSNTGDSGNSGDTGDTGDTGGSTGDGTGDSGSTSDNNSSSNGDSSSTTAQTNTSSTSQSGITSAASLASSYQALVTGIEYCLLSITLLSILSSLCSSLPLLNLWAFLNALQLIYFLQFLNLTEIPPYFLHLLSSLRVSIGRIPGLSILPYFRAHVISSLTTEPFPFEHSTAYQTTSLLLNIDLPLLCFLCYLFLIFILFILRALCSKNEKCINFLSQFWSFYFFWRLFQLIFLQFFFLAILSVSDLGFSSAADIFNAILTLSVLILFSGLFLSVSIFLLGRHYSLMSQTSEPNSRLLFGLNLQPKKCMRLMIVPLFFIERLAYALILSFLSSYPKSSVTLLLCASTIMFLYLVLDRPFLSSLVNVLSILNQVLLLSLIALLFYFSLINNPSSDATYGVDFFLVSLLLGGILMNLIVCILLLTKTLLASCKSHKSSQKYLSEVKPSDADQTDSIHTLEESEDKFPNNIKISRIKSKRKNTLNEATRYLH